MYNFVFVLLMFFSVVFSPGSPLHFKIPTDMSTRSTFAYQILLIVDSTPSKAQINKNINKMFNKPSEKTNSFKFVIINIPGLRINYISMDAEMIVGLHLASTV